MGSQDTDVAVIGAGPYGLSLAAHLKGQGATFRIVGKPMESWLAQMPRGMLLKSDGFASNLYDPDQRFTLAQFCAQRDIPFADLGSPVRLETFTSYGLEFQRKLLPELEPKWAAAIQPCDTGYLIRLDDGDTFKARRVVIAVGITHFQYLPMQISALSPAVRSHSGDHADLSHFKGRDVVVVGAGASAIDIASLLHETGARVRLVARRSALEIHYKMRLPRPFVDRLQAPLSGIGPSWRSRLLTDFPQLFRYLPERKRLSVVRNHLGPAGGWFMADRLAPVPLMLGYQLTGAEADGGRVQLRFAKGPDIEEVSTDHVIAATGYRPDLTRLTFLHKKLRQGIRVLNHAPVLSANFESSVPGLYFTGPVAAISFGPVMRFAFGAKFAAARLTRHLTRERARVTRSFFRGSASHAFAHELDGS
jgi:thioredoxin reductase